MVQLCVKMAKDPATEEKKWLRQVESEVKDFQLSLIRSNVDQGTSREINYPINVIGKENDLLITATKNNKLDIVDFLITSGRDLDINSKDKDGNSAANYAWDGKHYDILTLLLNADSVFPERFNICQVNDCDYKKKIRNVVNERKYFHECIKEINDLKKVQDFVTKYKLKYYLNKKNESAAKTAIKNKRFEIYAFLKSIGSEFLNKDESEAIKILERKERTTLADVMVKYFPSARQAHIYYLISKSRSQKPVEKFNQKIDSFYKKLDRIPEISVILKVIQYSDLDIIFDFDREDVTGIYPHEDAKDTNPGLTLFKRRRIYIAAKGKENNILGVLAHELTHFAMNIVFQNDCNPYKKSDSTREDKMKDVTISITKYFENRETEDLSESPEAEPLKAVQYNYKQHEVHSELIVRVPHILIQYEKGRECLNENFLSLFEFYTENVIPKCENFIRENCPVVPRNHILFINETFGELEKLKDCHILFKETNIKDLNLEGKTDKNIFFLVTNFSLLAMINVLQCIFGPEYIDCSCKYFILEFNNFMKRPLQILTEFYSEVSNIMIIRFLTKCSGQPLFRNEYDENQLNTGFLMIMELLIEKPLTKIILIADHDVKKKLLGVLQKLIAKINANNKKNVLSVEIIDEISEIDEISFWALTKESQKRILSTEIIIENTKTKLVDLVGSRSNSAVITTDIIENILEKKVIHITSTTSDLTRLEGSYVNVNAKIKEDTFKFELEHNCDDIFLIKGVGGVDKGETFTSYLGCNQTICNKTTKVISSDNIKMTVEKLLFTEDDQFSEEHFKKFCQKNPENKIYFIETEKQGNESTFLLQQVYNPEFYHPRILKKIVMDGNQIENMVKHNSSQYFKFSYDKKRNSILNVIKGYNNVEEVEEDIIDQNDERKDFHWLHFENDKLCWKHSSDSVGKIRKYINNNDADGKITEYQLVKELKKRRIFILAAGRRTGKSTTVNKILSTKSTADEKSIAETHWVIKIQREDIKNIKVKKHRDDVEDMTSKRLIELLQQMKPRLTETVNKNFLEAALNPEKSFSKCLLFVFDGLDENLNEVVRKDIFALLQYLRKKTDCKIWTTTSLLYKKKLEKALSAFAYRFTPLNGDIKQFIKRFFQDRLKLMFNVQRNRELFEDENSLEMEKYKELFLAIEINLEKISFFEIISMLGNSENVNVTLKKFKECAGE